MIARPELLPLRGQPPRFAAPQPLPPYRQPQLTFAPLAWLKLQFFCHAGSTEIGGFGITAQHDLLYVENFVTVRQRTSPMTVVMEDQAVADLMDQCVDRGLTPERCLRIWCHTHPGSSARPSSTDEETFDRVFGACDWAVMFILSRTSETYARLSLHVGPGAALQLAVKVDWSEWPEILLNPEFSFPDLLNAWQQEFSTNIQPIPVFLPTFANRFPAASMEAGRAADPFSHDDWEDFDPQFWEEYERHEPSLDPDFRP